MPYSAGLDNNLLSFMSFDKCKVAFYQRGASSLHAI